ncbi:MAG: alpha/beta hydrolase fold domain-containing protein [Candidatus Adiutrix sp.]
MMFKKFIVLLAIIMIMPTIAFAQTATPKSLNPSAGKIKAAGNQPEGEQAIKFPVMDITPTYKDVVVGAVKADDGRNLEIRMNVYKPSDTSQPTPVLIYVHGGRWQVGDYTCEKLIQGWSENGTFIAAMSLVEKGATVITAGYRVSDEAIFPAQVHDLKGTIRFIRANAQALNIDPKRIVVWGESAGGHLVNLLGTTEGVPELEGTTGGNLNFSSNVQGVVNYFGMTDILALAPDQYAQPHIISAADMYKQVDAAESSRSALFGFTGEGQGIGTLRANLGNPNTPYINPVSEYQAQLRLLELSAPLNFVGPKNAPFFIGQGGLDFRVASAQSYRFFDALTKAGVEAYLMNSSKAGHGDLGPAVDNAAIAFVLDVFSRNLE